jgi:hypothetical protein
MSRTYRSKEQARTHWQEVLNRWQQSGLSIAQFCRDQEISESGLYTWRKKLSLTHSATEPHTKPRSSKSSESPFVQVDVPSATHSQLTLELASGHTIHIAGQVNTDALVKVIGALQEARLC